MNSKAAQKLRFAVVATDIIGIGSLTVHGRYGPRPTKVHVMMRPSHFVGHPLAAAC